MTKGSWLLVLVITMAVIGCGSKFKPARSAGGQGPTQLIGSRACPDEMGCALLYWTVPAEPGLTGYQLFTEITPVGSPAAAFTGSGISLPIAAVQPIKPGVVLYRFTGMGTGEHHCFMVKAFIDPNNPSDPSNQRCFVLN